MTVATRSGAPYAETLGHIHSLVPAIVAALCFATCNVLCSFVFTAGGDVLTLTLLRGVIGLACVFLWLLMGEKAKPLNSKERAIALGLGVLFAGVIFGIFAALSLLPVPIAVLAYYVYPFVTGMAGSLLAIDRIGWRGVSVALIAFCGLALMIGADTGQLAIAGIGCALGAACCRAAILLIARATLPQADARLTTWYSLVSSTLIFALVALVTWSWVPPQTAQGWIALVVVSVANAIGVMALFVSTKRIGPIRTAVVMNLEPLLSAAFAWVVLGQMVSPMQFLGGAIMLAALTAFQWWMRYKKMQRGAISPL